MLKNEKNCQFHSKFRLRNHTYEIIASNNPFKITVHIVHWIGAILVFITLGLLFFTDIGLGNFALKSIKIRQTRYRRYLEPIKSFTEYSMHCISEFVNGYLDQSNCKRSTFIYLTHRSTSQS